MKPFGTRMAALSLPNEIPEEDASELNFPKGFDIFISAILGTPNITFEDQ